tara:strand:- start:302 stop:1378 length:1077 start_codon:yes stop_codon:yes gene_type:complete
MNNQILIIAEAGVNHNGSLELAKKLIDVAARSGADIVKFQTFKATKLASASAKQAVYQEKNTGIAESQVDMLKRLELKYEDHFTLVDYCKLKNIEFLSTAFDEESLDFLTEELGQKLLKIPSGELTNAPLVLAHARTGLDIILSTGMATLSEIETALGVIAFGLLQMKDKPSVEKFENAYFSAEGQRLLKGKVTILHCTTEYPAPLEDINLSAMHTIMNAFKLDVGYSDHSQGIVIPIAAAALQAKIIEKHFTLDHSMEGPDHKASLEPNELEEMVRSIRKVEQALGDGIKGPRPSEIKNKAIARKSLVAAKTILKGQELTEDCIEIKRPGDGVSPINYWDVLHTKASKNYEEDELLK